MGTFIAIGMIIVISTIIFGLYFRDLLRHRLDLRTMIITSIFVAISYILYLIHIVKYPQGGGITLFSMMPIMVLGILYGRTAGLTGGIIFGLFKLLNGAYIVHPVQFLLDYILGTMPLGLAGIFGIDKKYKIILGSLLATGLGVLASFISGVIFFGQYAPEGMNVYLYSFIYNFSSAGVEGIITSIAMVAIPYNRLAKAGRLEIKQK